MPPPKSRSGVERSVDSLINGSLEKAKVKTWKADKSGLASQIMTKGRPPRIKKTANKMPQNKKIFRYFSGTVFKTWALIIALSMLLMISNKTKPKTTRKKEKNMGWSLNLRKQFNYRKYWLIWQRLFKALTWFSDLFIIELSLIEFMPLIKQKKFILFIFLSFLVMSLFGMNLPMNQDEHGQMSNCPFMVGSFSFCQMNLINHLTTWQGLFRATSSLYKIVLLIAITIFTLYSLIEKIINSPPLVCFPFWYRLNQKNNFFNYLNYVFSQGILHSKIFIDA